MRVGLNKVVPLTVGGSKFVDLNALTISVPEAVEEEQPQGAARKGRGGISGIRYGLFRLTVMSWQLCSAHRISYSSEPNINQRLEPITPPHSSPG